MVKFTNRRGEILQAIAVLEPTTKPGDAWMTFRVAERCCWLNGRAISYVEAVATVATWREQNP